MTTECKHEYICEIVPYIITDSHKYYYAKYTCVICNKIIIKYPELQNDS